MAIVIIKLCDLTGNQDLYESIYKKLAGEIEHQFMTYDTLNKYFGWKPRHSIDDGLKHKFNWYKDFLEKYDYKDF